MVLKVLYVRSLIRRLRNLLYLDGLLQSYSVQIFLPIIFSYSRGYFVGIIGGKHTLYINLSSIVLSLVKKVKETFSIYKFFFHNIPDSENMHMTYCASLNKIYLFSCLNFFILDLKTRMKTSIRSKTHKYNTNSQAVKRKS